MHSEWKRRNWHLRAEEIYNDIEHLDEFERTEIFRNRLTEIKDGAERSAVELLVWYWVKDGKKLHWITINNTILAGTFIFALLILLYEIGVSFIFASAISLAFTAIVHLIFRLFDRGFMFRRLFIACISAGLLLIMPAQLHFQFETPFGPVSWGGPPELALLFVWGFGTLVTFIGALYEHYVFGRN
ncbi:hypothetical protein [Mesorhizobium sp. Z1-4]|uniref:hypothetical protein n=1 Tax=Mesorhizobium sp. Z1-4 TaxID=2448478 RepID=UPI000FDACC32|nr:hypothetical protein [Mesorhizobium sp. Z1-4]